MRTTGGPALLLAMLVVPLLAGCAHPNEPARGDATDLRSPNEPDRLVDHLTQRLAPQSGPFYPDLILEDGLDLPGGGRMEFAVGLGMRCQGNATSVAAPNATGWVTCQVRLAAEHEALSTARRELELGFDYTPLSPRAAAEPVEWRVVVETADAAGNLSTVFDSGWRTVDLSPRLQDPRMDIQVIDPCDGPDAQEKTDPPLGPTGLAVVNVTMDVSHAQVTVVVDLNRSIPGAPSTYPYAAPDPGAHNLTARFPVWDRPLRMSLSIAVDPEAKEEAGPDPNGPCTVTANKDPQTWVATITTTGADGRRTVRTLSADIDVYLTIQP